LWRRTWKYYHTDVEVHALAVSSGLVLAAGRSESGELVAMGVGGDGTPVWTCLLPSDVLNVENALVSWHLPTGIAGFGADAFMVATHVRLPACTFERVVIAEARAGPAAVLGDGRSVAYATNGKVGLLVKDPLGGVTASPAPPEGPEERALVRSVELLRSHLELEDAIGPIWSVAVQPGLSCYAMISNGNVAIHPLGGGPRKVVPWPALLIDWPSVALDGCSGDLALGAGRELWTRRSGTWAGVDARVGNVRRLPLTSPLNDP
jgi:hypothetical protein